MKCSEVNRFPFHRLNDPARLAALVATGLPDSSPEEQFDRLTRLVSNMLGVPVALVSLVDDRRQFFKSQHGLPEPRETPLSHSFCQHVVIERAPLIVEDAEDHPVVRTNLAIPDFGVKAYLGVPLITGDGYVLGSLCAIDTSPRKWSCNDLAVMQDIAAIVMSEIALRAEISQRMAAEQNKQMLIDELHHRVKNSLATVQSLIHLTLNSSQSLDTFGDRINARITSLAKTHDLLIGNRWQAVELEELITGQLAAQDHQGRFVIAGPKVIIGADIATNVGMIFHELVTNAAKYGALSTPSGKVTVNWDVKPHSDVSDMQVVNIDWQESGGPTVKDDGRRGFGSKLLDQLIRGQFDGQATATMDPTGLQFQAKINVPIVSPVRL